MSLITLDQFKKLPLGLKADLFAKIGDPALQAFIDTASEQVATYCNRVLARQTVSQDIVGNGKQRFILREYPVTALAKVTWEDEFGYTGTHDVTLFRITSSGLLTWKNPLYGPFLSGRVYTIEYTAGYDPIPGPVQHATGLWVTELLQPTFAVPSGKDQSDLVALSSEQIGELLEGYRRKGGL